ncbi:putative ribonuclease H-like domain-containing protein [Tanacetum coccineum]
MLFVGVSVEGHIGDGWGSDLEGSLMCMSYCVSGGDITLTLSLNGSGTGDDHRTEKVDLGMRMCKTLVEKGWTLSRDDSVATTSKTRLAGQTLYRERGHTSQYIPEDCLDTLWIHSMFLELHGDVTGLFMTGGGWYCGRVRVTVSGVYSVDIAVRGEIGEDVIGGDNASDQSRSAETIGTLMGDLSTCCGGGDSRQDYEDDRRLYSRCLDRMAFSIGISGWVLSGLSHYRGYIAARAYLSELIATVTVDVLEGFTVKDILDFSTGRQEDFNYCGQTVVLFSDVNSMKRRLGSFVQGVAWVHVGTLRIWGAVFKRSGIGTNIQWGTGVGVVSMGGEWWQIFDRDYLWSFIGGCGCVGFVVVDMSGGEVLGELIIVGVALDSRLREEVWEFVGGGIGFVLGVVFMKPFGCPVTILNTRDHLGKFNGKADKGFFVGYSIVSKAMRVFNKRTRIVEETLNIRFLENTPNVTGNGPDYLFDVDSLTISMNYVPVVAGNQTNGIAGTRNNIVTGQAKKKTEPEQEYILIPIYTTDPLISQDPKVSEEDAKEKPTKMDESGASNKDEEDDQAIRSEFERLLQQEKHTENPNSTNSINTVSTPISVAGPSFTNDDPSLPINDAEASNAFEEHLFERFSLFKNAFTLLPVLNVTPMDDNVIFNSAYDDEDVGAEANFNNLETTMNVSPIPTTKIDKDHPKDQIIGEFNLAIQTRRMTNIFDEHAMVWTLVNLPNDKRVIGTKWVFRNKKDERSIVVRNKARLVAQCYTQKKGIDYDEMDVKSAFLYGTIDEEVYDCQPPAWYETLSTYLIENGFRRGTIDKTLFIKKDKGDILLVQVYVDDIIFGSTKKSLCDEFEGLMHKRFHMSSMRELTFFLGLQVQQKKDGIFISQDKYVADILKKFDFATVKTASTPMEPNKALIKDEEADSVDVHLYRSMIGSLMYLTASRPDIMFAVCACARFQVTPKMSHLHAVKRIFRYLKGQPKLGLWYPRDSPFDLEAFSNSDYAGASLDRKSTTGGCQFLGKRLISWQCKKQTIVANSTTEAEYVAAANCCGQYSRPINLVAYETVCKEWEDRMERAATTASSLDAEHDSGNINRTQSMATLNESFPQETDSGSDPRTLNQASLHQMENLDFCDTHNMVAFLNKSEGSEGFQHIVDFLNTSHIKFALTKNPTIYTSLIQQFWQTASTSTLEDGEGEITATIAGQLKTITEASLRRHLKLEDADGISSLPNTKIFEQLALMGYASDSDKLTFQKCHFSPQWIFLIHTILHCLSLKKTVWEQFSSNIATAIICLATNRTFNFSKMIFEGMVKNLDSSNMRMVSKVYSGVDILLFSSMLVQGPIQQDEGSTFLVESHHTPITTPSTSQPPLSSPSRVPTPPHDLPLPGGHTPRSDEGRMQHTELMDLVIKLSDKVLALETDLQQTKKVYSTTVTKLIMKVKRLEKIVKSSKARRRAKIVVSDDEKVLEDSSKQGRMIDDIDQDARITLVTPTKTSTQEDHPEDQLGVLSAAKNSKKLHSSSRASKDKGKDVITESEPDQTALKLKERQERAGYEATIKLQEQRRHRMVKVHQATQGFTEDEWENIRGRLEADEELTQKLQAEEREKYSEVDQAKMLVDLNNQRNRFFAQQRAEAKRNKPMTQAQQKTYMSDYIKNQEGVQRLKRASQKVLEEPAQRQKIGKASRSSEEQSAEKEKEVSEEELQKLLVIVPVEEVYIEALQVLWVELKRLFEPDDDDDTLWKLQRYMHDPLKWRLYDTCGVHHVSTERGHDIFMLVEKDYPLTRALMTVMLANKLQVDESS